MDCAQARQSLWPPERPRLVDASARRAREHVASCECCTEWLQQDRALLDAARRGDIGALVAALSDGARLDARADDRHGNTALHLAVHHGHGAAVNLLLERGAAGFLHDLVGYRHPDIGSFVEIGNCQFRVIAAQQRLTARTHLVVQKTDTDPTLVVPRDGAVADFLLAERCAR